MELPCRRSVLPGRKFGCQRPLACCMHGETYRRDIDCDGDGHFDHVCETAEHAGFISSAMDCIDTWEEGSNGRKCDPTPVASPEVSYRLKLDSGDCAQHTTQQCVVSHKGWPGRNCEPGDADCDKYPPTSCRFHVEWDKAPAASTGCDPPPVTETLWLEVSHMDIEEPVFKTSGGFQYGDRLQVDGEILSPDRDEATGRYKEIWREVRDDTNVVWKPDSSYEKEGWMACLRLRSKIQDVYHAKCSEIGDDLLAGLDVHDLMSKDTKFVKVSCEEKCPHYQVIPLSDIDAQKPRYRFLRTSNVCDAGHQVTGRNEFVISFRFAEATTEASFEVGLHW